MSKQYVTHSRKPGWVGYIHEFPMWGANRQLAAVCWVEAKDDNGEAIAIRNPMQTYAIGDLVKVSREAIGSGS